MLRKHTRTAKWCTPDGTTIDVATARTETYPGPAQLPVVAPTDDILLDLGRRDFSINALAYGVGGLC